MPTRRKFLRNAALTGAGLSVGLPAMARGSVIGTNDRVNVAVFGTNSRGNQLTKSFTHAKDCLVYGTGSGSTERANYSTMVLTKSTCAAGRWT
jgi:hypothetical protein